MRLRGGASNHVNVSVTIDEAVCVARRDGDASIHWHLRTPAATAAPAVTATLAMTRVAR